MYTYFSIYAAVATKSPPSATKMVLSGKCESSLKSKSTGLIKLLSLSSAFCLKLKRKKS